jgi:hypothetical protein
LKALPLELAKFVYTNLLQKSLSLPPPADARCILTVEELNHVLLQCLVREGGRRSRPGNAVYEHYMLHMNELEMAFEEDNHFSHTDRENASRINGRCSSYNVGGILNDVYCIYGAGAPFERLFFEARRQLDDAILQLGYERKEREFEKASDPLFDDYNFFEGHAVLQAALLDTEGRLDSVNKRRKAELWEMRDTFFANEQRVQELGEHLGVRRRKETRWRRKYMEVFGDKFVDRPASA